MLALNLFYSDSVVYLIWAQSTLTFSELISMCEHHAKVTNQFGRPIILGQNTSNLSDGLPDPKRISGWESSVSNLKGIERSDRWIWWLMQ